MTPKPLQGGRYMLLRQLGEGSQGETYEARVDDTPRVRPDPARLGEAWEQFVRRARAGQTPSPEGLVAIKCFRVGTAKAWKDVELAEREARTLASLDHPRLPRYIEHFEEGGVLYLVMEKVEGESLAQIRARQRTMSIEEVTRMLEDIGEALRYLHTRAPAVVHRDIKPGNILRAPDGSYALVDFGAVRNRLKPGGGSTVVGTFGYMAPEQFQGRASPQSDVYGLAATALSVLTGREPEELPHEGLGIDVLRSLPRSTPRPLARALAAMLVPDPERRAGSIDDALALLRGDEEPAAQVAAPPRKRKRERGRESREARRQRRRAARARRAPFVPRVATKLALFVASIAVWLAVGVVTPVLLVLLSLVFGQGLRETARSCRAASRRSLRAMSRASAWVSGHRSQEEGEGASLHARVAADPGAIRVDAGAASPDLEDHEDDLDHASERPGRARQG
jgi:hypothetical protein